MQFPESWLREFCNPPITTEQLAETLTMAGLEVEELKPVAPPFTKIVVGEIMSAAKHPNADKLQVCEVDVGQGSLLNIVCGAPNARIGIKVPCALVGAVLPPGEDGKPFLIKVGQLRGVESQGMLCSARELEIVRTRVPGAGERLSREIVAFVQRLRSEELFKNPGVAETLDWATALTELDQERAEKQGLPAIKRGGNDGAGGD